MKKLKITIIFFVAVSIFSCKDIMEKYPHNSVADVAFWQTSADALQGLTSCYAEFYSNYLSAAGFDAGYRVEWGDGFTDNMYEDAMGAVDFTTGQHIPTTGGVITSYYYHCFDIITAVNKFLSRVEDVDMDADLKASYEAEARFLRAFAYHELVLCYGDVPLFRSEPSLDEVNVGRTDVSEIMEFVHDDLDFAIANLPNESYYDGHVVKNSALALKARVCLYSEDWSGAVQYAGQVMSSGMTQLYLDYQDMFFEGQGSDNKEILFSIRFQYPDRAHSMTNNITFQLSENVLEDLVNDYYTINGLPIDEDPEYDPDALWLNRDPRLRMSVYTEPGEPWIWDQTNGYSYFYRGAFTQFKIKKYTCTYEQRNRDEDDQDFIHLRYGDVLLMYAEAKNELGQFTEDDWDNTIRLLRERAGFTADQAIEFPGGTQVELREEIRHERRIELALEGLRYYDLMRWDIMKEAWEDIEGYNPQEKIFNESKGYLWPIPQNEIDYYENNGVDFPQNPGY